VVVRRREDRFNGPALALGVSLTMGCLPSATIEPAAEPALAPAPTPDSANEQCRALLSERSDRGPLTHELRWDGKQLRSTQSFSGMIVGTADDLFAISATRGPFDATELYGVGEPDLRCEVDTIWVRRLPHGVKQSLFDGAPACVGKAKGHDISVESTLELLSAIGPLVGVRARYWGRDPIPTNQLVYQTADLRTFENAPMASWLLEPTSTMAQAEDSPNCDEYDAPRSLDDTRGFALTWDGLARPRVHVAFGCCIIRTCEIDDPLPRPDPELAAMLPDDDGLLHSPFGCGSIGLDGSVRRRDGALVGNHDVDPSKLLGVVFLPIDHAFAPGWLDD
jgi:hypothetical protein